MFACLGPMKLARFVLQHHALAFMDKREPVFKGK
jgi:hypothetical protein